MPLNAASAESNIIDTNNKVWSENNVTYVMCTSNCMILLDLERNRSGHGVICSDNRRLQY